MIDTIILPPPAYLFIRDVKNNTIKNNITKKKKETVISIQPKN
jgi:hypothetical protein